MSQPFLAHWVSRNLPAAKTAAIALLLCAPGAARADFNLSAPPPPPTPFAGAQTVSGFGTKIPLIIGATQIVPPPMLVEFGGGVNVNTEITWQGQGRPWREVLASALEPAHLKFIEDGLRISIEPDGTAPSAPVEVAILPAAAATGAPTALVPVASGSTPAPAISGAAAAGAPASVAAPPAAAPAAPARPEEIWVAQKGDYLFDTLTAWAKRAHCDFEDNTGRDYKIKTTFTATGDFLEAAARLINEGFEYANPPLFLHTWPENCDAVLTRTSDDFGTPSK